MESNKDQMLIMHSLCWKEIACLKRNLDKFIEDSERCQKLLKGINSSEEVPNIFSLIVFDRYMTQMVTVLNMTRKYNIHLEINNLDHTVINASSNGCLEDTNFTQTRLLKDFIEWRKNNLDNDVTYNGEVNTRAERIKMTEHTSETNEDYVVNSEKARIKFLEMNYNRVLTKNQHLKKPNEIMGNEVDNLLNILLPKKNLDHFKNNYEFQAYIVYVSDLNKLEFFICQIEDYKTLYDLSSNLNFKPISRDSLASDDVFCVLEKKETNIRECLWRAVCVPPNGTVEPHKLVYLIDIGEIIPLLDQCETYEAPLRYRDIAPLAIRCVLEGVEDSKTKNITKDQDVCKRALHTVEFQKVNFRTICKKDQVLYVVMLETPKSTVISSTTNEKNPFLNTEAFENDEQNSSANSEALQLPRSAVYHKSPIRDPVLNICSEIGDRIQIIVTHIISPISFYGIIQNDYFGDYKIFSWHDHQIGALQKQMLSPPQINGVVLSQYVKDNYWYRARVIDIDPENDLYKVFYVDFGNTEVVHLSNLAKCSEEQLKDPLRAVLFHLSNLSIVSDEQDILPSAKTRFKSAIENIVVMILDQILNVEVIERRKDDLVVRLIDSQYVDIPKMLVDMGVVVEI